MRKIVFDFDGVLTDLTHEAQLVIDLFAKRLGPSSQELLTYVKTRFQSYPMEHGWKMNGRISAFYNEDLFIQNIATAHALDEASEKEAGQQALQSSKKWIQDQHGAKTFSDLGQICFNEVIAQTARGEIEPLEIASRELLNQLQDDGIQVVIVSNSETDRIEKILKNSQVKMGSLLKIRGGAKKFALGNQPQKIKFVDREVEIDRPFYLKALLEEKPDAVVGDVFSLDLALPLHLSESGQLNGVKVCLRQRAYTPAWTVNNIKKFSARNSRLVAISELKQVLD